jgi:preprotein translocase subunit SecA
MRIFGSERLQAMLSRLGLQDGEAIVHPWISKTLEKAQNKVEMRNYEIRKNLIKYDDVVNEQRKIIFGKRAKLINSKDVSGEIDVIRQEIAEDVVVKHIPKNSYSQQWDIDGIENEIQRIFGLKLDIKILAEKEGVCDVEILDFINEQTKEHFLGRKELYGDLELQLQRQIFLASLDEEWKDHLLSLDKLRHGINLRAYGQKDPLIEYKRESYDLFENMMLAIEEKTLSRISHSRIKTDDDSQAQIDILKQIASKQKMFAGRFDPNMPDLSDGNSQPKPNRVPVKTKIDAKDRDPNNVQSWGNVGRNEPCPCGSKKKYKQCHGRAV